MPTAATISAPSTGAADTTHRAVRVVAAEAAGRPRRSGAACPSSPSRGTRACKEHHVLEGDVPADDMKCKGAPTSSRPLAAATRAAASAATTAATPNARIGIQRPAAATATTTATRRSIDRPETRAGLPNKEASQIPDNALGVACGTVHAVHPCDSGATRLPGLRIATADASRAAEVDSARPRLASHRGYHQESGPRPVPAGASTEAPHASVV